jgi:ABC-type transporter Mla subunit MlaD
VSSAIDKIAGALHRLSEVSIAAAHAANQIETIGIAAVHAANQIERLADAAHRFVDVVQVEAPRFVDAVERLSGKEPAPRSTPTATGSPPPG